MIRMACDATAVECDHLAQSQFKEGEGKGRNETDYGKGLGLGPYKLDGRPKACLDGIRHHGRIPRYRESVLEPAVFNAMHVFVEHSQVFAGPAQFLFANRS